MWISNLILENIRSFVGDNSVEFSENIYLIVGQNNSGKSTILNSILILQQFCLSIDDVTLGEERGRIVITLKGLEKTIVGIDENALSSGFDSVLFSFNRTDNNTRSFIYNPNNRQTRNTYRESSRNEPHNAIYPYLSKRKVANFEELVNLNSTNSVTGNFAYLYAKIDRLSTTQLPSAKEFETFCREIIGFPISTVASSNGKKSALIISDFSYIPLTAMGEGVPNLLGLIVDLCVAKKKIFLIEEPENDIHPKALKSLLELIKLKSEYNQFFISTHSNIVTKYLGSVEGSKVFKVSMSFDNENKLPVSKVQEIENEPSARLQLLEELGYEPFDFGQWKAWLILEESSAEVIIRNFLIPTFVSKLKNKLRTYSARTLSEVEPKFKDFNNLFVFIHLEQIYKNKAWVIVDAGENEREIINKMRETYSQNGWNEANFLQFSEHDFEKYYPQGFQVQVNEILATTNKKQKMERKKELVEEVKQWIKDFPDEAKREFAVSAKEVIDILKSINKNIE